MTITAALRSAAIATAVVGFIDPSWTARRRAPVAVELLAPVTTDGDDLRHRLARSLGNEVTFNSEAEPAAVVVVGGTAPRSAHSREGVTVSTVSIARPESPNVRVVAADEPAKGRVGWSAVFHGVIEANGLAGKSSRIVLEAHGTELAHVEHRWTRDSERFDATLRYTPPASGTSTMTLRVVPAEGETTDADNAADLRFVASARRLSVLVHEPRPSWNATFIRRALEQDPSFEVSSLVQASRGLEVRAGTPPGALTADALSAFDAVVIGAPEELRPSEVEAVRLFARRRGGAVVLVPDRRPSGPYLELIPAPQFDEVLVENAIELRQPGDGMTSIGVPLRASEIVVHRAGVPGGQVLAALEGKGAQDQAARSVVVEWPDGAGRVLFSGAMDAWRFRAASDDGFARFWRARIAEGASAAPARLEVSVAPGVPRPGQTVRFARVFVRRSSSRGRRAARSCLRSALGSSGPTAPRKPFACGQRRSRESSRADWKPRPQASTDLQVSTATGATVDEVISVVAGARHPPAAAEDTTTAARLVATATGGVAVSTADLAPLERHLRSLASREVERTVRPGRSWLLVIAFAALLSAEWTLRRRRGRA